VASVGQPIAPTSHTLLGTQLCPDPGQVHRLSTHEPEPAQQSVSNPQAAPTSWQPGPATVMTGALPEAYGWPELVPAFPAQYANVTPPFPENRAA
jgi:hypothetical protein